ncbi:MAG: hypothetical protein A3H45_10510 [Ignavibacteria bacterium RIFCSPLOWO2_02_FULL_55_14]|nr:MAG: hypothetical protein A3H45_10510 [Ignavibacteria bacterium RIFCSPLOWO2_02_FULL_55_14]
MIYPLILMFAAATARVVDRFWFDGLVGMVAWQWVVGDLYVWNYQKALNRREKYGGPPRNLFAFDTDVVELTVVIVMLAFFSWLFGRIFGFGF